MSRETTEKTKQSKGECAKKTNDDFTYLKVIGEGSFSTVHLAKEKSSEKLFAIKECVKSQIIKEKKVKYIHLEKKNIGRNSHK